MDRGRRIVELLFVGILGFCLGWAGFWTYKSYLLMQEPVKVDYNIIEKSLSDFVDSEYDPENYLGKAEGTK